MRGRSSSSSVRIPSTPPAPPPATKGKKKTRQTAPPPTHHQRLRPFLAPFERALGAVDAETAVILVADRDLGRGDQRRGAVIHHRDHVEIVVQLAPRHAG